MGRVYQGLNLTPIILGMFNTRKQMQFPHFHMVKKKIHFGYMNKLYMSA